MIYRIHDEDMHHVEDVLTTYDCDDVQDGPKAFVLDIAPVVDDEGVTWEPYAHEGVLGFRAVHPDGRVAYVYLNPSGGSDDGVATVFMYEGTEGTPQLDTPVTYIAPFHHEGEDR